MWNCLNWSTVCTLCTESATTSESWSCAFSFTNCHQCSTKGSTGVTFVQICTNRNQWYLGVVLPEMFIIRQHAIQIFFSWKTYSLHKHWISQYPRCTNNNFNVPCHWNTGGTAQMTNYFNHTFTNNCLKLKFVHIWAWDFFCCFFSLAVHVYKN